MKFLHLLSDYLRSPAFRERFNAFPYDYQRLKVMREEYDFSSDDIALIVGECRPEIAQNLSDSFMRVDLDAPPIWSGVEQAITDALPAIGGAPTTAPVIAGGSGVGWPGPQWMCVETAEPNCGPVGQATRVRILGWHFIHKSGNATALEFTLANPDGTFTRIPIAAPPGGFPTDSVGRSAVDILFTPPAKGTWSLTLFTTTGPIATSVLEAAFTAT